MLRFIIIWIVVILVSLFVFEDGYSRLLVFNVGVVGLLGSALTSFRKLGQLDAILISLLAGLFPYYMWLITNPVFTDEYESTVIVVVYGPLMCVGLVAFLLWKQDSQCNWTCRGAKGILTGLLIVGAGLTPHFFMEDKARTAPALVKVDNILVLTELTELPLALKDHYEFLLDETGPGGRVYVIESEPLGTYTPFCWILEFQDGVPWMLSTEGGYLVAEDLRSLYELGPTEYREPARIEVAIPRQTQAGERIYLVISIMRNIDRTALEQIIKARTLEDRCAE